MEASPLRVIIAEDSALIREGIARLIQESGGTVVAKGTALDPLTGPAKVCKATWQPGTTELDVVGNMDLMAKVMMFPWRVVSLGQGGVGTVGGIIVIEKLG